MIRKDLVTTNIETTDTEDGVKLSFVASTGTPDRFGDVVDPRGWSTESYEKNNIILLNHRPDLLPIGKGNIRFSDEKLWKDRKMIVDVEFDMNDPESARIAQKAKGGFLNAVSVGFNPKDAIKRSDLEEKHWAYTSKGGMFFPKAELLEISVVTIPANPEATILQNYTVRDLTNLVKKILQDDVLSSVDPLYGLTKMVKSIDEIGEFITIRIENSEQSMEIVRAAFPGIPIKRKQLGFNHYLISALTEEK